MPQLLKITRAVSALRHIMLYRLLHNRGKEDIHLEVKYTNNVIDLRKYIIIQTFHHDILLIVEKV